MTKAAKITVSVTALALIVFLIIAKVEKLFMFTPLDSPVTVAGGSISASVDMIVAGRVWTPDPTHPRREFSVPTDKNDQIWTESIVVDGTNNPPTKLSGNGGWRIVIKNQAEDQTTNVVRVCSAADCSLSLVPGTVYAKSHDNSYWKTDTSRRALRLVDESNGCKDDPKDPCNEITSIRFEVKSADLSNPTVTKCHCKDPHNCQIHIGDYTGSYSGH